jgi:hypothetical protein
MSLDYLEKKKQSKFISSNPHPKLQKFFDGDDEECSGY